MSNMKVFIALFLLFLIEGTWAAIFSWHYATPFVYLTLIGLMYVGLYGRFESALGFGLVFGLLYDIVYTDLLGIYLFTFSLIPLLVSFVLKYIGENFFSVVITFTFMILVFSFGIYGIMAAVGGTTMTIQTLLVEQIPGTLVVNVIAVAILYYPMTRYVAVRPVAKRG